MDRRDLHILTRELRSIYKQLDDVGRRVAASHMTGTVAEVNGDRVRLQLLEQGASGAPFLSPWVQVQEAAGATGSHFPVKVGDPMRLFSPQGELGPQSLAIRDGYTDHAPNPAGSVDEFALTYGGCAIRIRDGKIVLEGPVLIEGPTLTHNGRSVGDDHLHTGVVPGGGLTGAPQ